MSTTIQTAVKERPIIMGAESVRAILEGRKTATRRVIKPQPADFVKSIEFCEESRDTSGHYPIRDVWVMCDGDEAFGHFRCPYGKPGDRLIVREDWKHYGVRITAGKVYALIAYKDGARAEREVSVSEVPEVPRNASETYWRRWRSPIFMPRWASRLTLEMTGVRVERLQDITEADAVAEGFAREPVFDPANPDTGTHWLARPAFFGGWDRLNKARGFGWVENPFVWVISFRRVG